jgi:hypothetical protein
VSPVVRQRAITIGASQVPIAAAASSAAASGPASIVP